MNQFIIKKDKYGTERNEIDLGFKQGRTSYYVTIKKSDIERLILFLQNYLKENK